jgi:hypothetical protein
MHVSNGEKMGVGSARRLLEREGSECPMVILWLYPTVKLQCGGEIIQSLSIKYRTVFNDSVNLLGTVVFQRVH